MKKLLTACCMLTGCMLCLHGHAQSVNIPSDSFPSSDKKWPSDVVAVAFGPKSSYHGRLLVKKVPPTYHGHLLVKKPDDKKRHLRVVPAPGIEDKPEHITKWCQASDDWHAPYAENDLRDGGKFKTTMAAKDGSFSFDFEGVYDEVAEHSNIAYTMADGRKVNITFSEEKEGTRVAETFDPEDMNSREMQQAGWQAILDNFKKYTEGN